MQIKLYSIFLLLFLTLGLNHAYSQKSPAKFGKMEAKDLETTVCPIDKDAHAYYIFDHGTTFFEYVTGKGFRTVFTRQLRIKILDNQAFDLANIEQRIYHDDDAEIISKIKGYTYNLENGKVVKTKFDKKDIKKEKTSKYWTTVKFAMPNVKEGSVIEVQYTLRSPFVYNLPTWYFQKSIPVLQSHYSVSIPEYFRYNFVESGYLSIQKTTDSRQRKIVFNYKEGNNPVNRPNSQKGNAQASDTYIGKIFNYDAKAIPAFPNEPYLKTRKNYISKIKFELESITYPNSTPDYYTSTWADIDEKMIEYYEKALKRTEHLKQDIGYLHLSGEKGLPLLTSALEQMKKQISWDGFRNIYTTNTVGALPIAYKKSKGNCTDVNLNLVALLRELGFKSNPVMISTQDNGFVHTANPSRSSFNYVIAMVKLDGKTYLLDATDPYSEINLLPRRCLNNKGRVIGNTSEKWINLMSYRTYSSSSSYTLVLSEDLTVKGKVRRKLKDYGAYFQRKSIKEEGKDKHKGSDADEDTEDEEDTNANRVVKNITASGLDDLGKPLELNFEVSHTDYAEKNGEMIYFSPAFDPFFKKNLFKLEKREYPVEFDYAYKIQRTYSIEIPEDYVVSEMPKPLILNLPDKTLSFMYQVSQLGNKINVMSIIKIKRDLFLPEEYKGLKEVFQTMIDKQKEMVVLKKKT